MGNARSISPIGEGDGMKLTIDTRVGIMVGLLLVGDGPEGTAKKLFARLHKAWPYLTFSDICDGTLRDQIARECNIDLDDEPTQ